MQRYDFEVSRGGEMIAADRSILLRGTRAAWPRIAKLATTFDAPGCLIRVKDEAGQTVILVGADSARRSLGVVVNRV
jgi:hypothetical protein